ncbi:hypothetical protein GCM10009080_46410 [Cupriavidus pauculus]|nr:hypothetical protein C3Z06_08690 [Cupriavidus metallidurans]
MRQSPNWEAGAAIQNDRAEVAIRVDILQVDDAQLTAIGARSSLPIGMASAFDLFTARGLGANIVRVLGIEDDAGIVANLYD